MDINGLNANNANAFNPSWFNTNMLMSVFLGIIIVVLIVILFQSSSAGNNSSSPNQTGAVGPLAYTNPLNATMRANPFVNPAQRPI